MHVFLVHCTALLKHKVINLLQAVGILDYCNGLKNWKNLLYRDGNLKLNSQYVLVFSGKLTCSEYFMHFLWVSMFCLGMIEWMRIGFPQNGFTCRVGEGVFE